MPDDNNKDKTSLELVSCLLQCEPLLGGIQEVFEDLFDYDSSKTIIDIESESFQPSQRMIASDGRPVTSFNPNFGLSRLGDRNHRSKKRKVSKNTLDKRKKQSDQKKARKITKKK